MRDMMSRPRRAGDGIERSVSLSDFGVIYFGNDWLAENRTSSLHIAERLAHRDPALQTTMSQLRNRMLQLCSPSPPGWNPS